MNNIRKGLSDPESLDNFLRKEVTCDEYGDVLVLGMQVRNILNMNTRLIDHLITKGLIDVKALEEISGTYCNLTIHPAESE